MKKKVLLFSLMVLIVSFGFSREKGKFGFLFKSGSTSSVGLSINLSDSLTLRPSLGFRTTKTEEEYDQGPADTDKRNDYNVNLGLFYHFLKKDRFSVYSGLDFGYSYQKIEGIVCVGGICGNQTDKIHGYNGNVILGLQYNLNKHLAVFGEIGFGFQRQKADIEADICTADYKYTEWNLSRSGFGIILYL